MPLIVNELEVTVAPEARPSAGTAAPTGPGGSGGGAAAMTPQRVLALAEGRREREERLRAH